MLKSLHPGEFAKRPKPTELMMRSRAIDHLGKGRPVLFAIAKEKPMEEGNKFVVKLSCVEDLDLRMSLFQPWENSVNCQAQALVQSPFVSDVFGDFYKGSFNSCVRHACGLVLRSKSMRELRRNKLEGFQECST